MRTRRWTALLLVSFIGGLACDAGNDRQVQPEIQRRVTAQATGQKADRYRSKSQVTLLPQGNSGVGGTALIVRPPGDSIELRVTLHGVEPGTTYPVHIHRGICQTGGSIATSLQELTAQDSMASSASKFPAAELSPDGPYFVQAYRPDGSPAACGNVPTGAFESLTGE